MVLDQGVRHEHITADLVAPGDFILHTLDVIHLILVLLQSDLVQLGFQHFHGVLTVLQLAALGLAGSDNAGGLVDQTHSGRRFVDVLAACTGRTVNLHFNIRRVDLDFNIVIQFRHNLQAGKAGLAAGVGIKRADAHQAVHAVFTFQHTVSVGTLNHHRSGLDTGFIAFQHIQNFHGVAVGFGPAGVHTGQHLGPVLCFGAAGACMESQDSVGMVVLAVQHGHQLQFVNGFLHAIHSFFAFCCQRGIIFFLNHFQQGLGFLVLGGKFAEALQLIFHFAHLADDFLAFFLVIIKTRQRHLVFQLCQALFARFNGKGIAQVVYRSFQPAELKFQFVNGDHICYPLVNH